MELMRIAAAERPEQKAKIVAEVLRDLPEWFGIEEATQAYIERARGQELVVCRNGEEVLGFVTLAPTSAVTVEIYCMGVKRQAQRRGVGRSLIKAAVEWARLEYRIMQVKTVAEGEYVIYDRTIAFYRAQGFVDLEVLPELWGPENPCLILVRSLA